MLDGPVGDRVVERLVEVDAVVVVLALEDVRPLGGAVGVALDGDAAGCVVLALRLGRFVIGLVRRFG